jgi:hypothetical protein
MFQERPHERIFDTMEELEAYMDLYVDLDVYSYEIRKVYPATSTKTGDEE